MVRENNILTYPTEWLKKNKGIHTASEIAGQPPLWLKTWDLIYREKHKIKDFMDTVLAEPELDIILTGAGTSAYIGESLVGHFKKYTGKNVRAIATTELVSCPDDYLSANRPTLLVSFARSGNSPESVGAVQLANQLCDKVYHLVITCNKDGELAKLSSGDNYCCFQLPEEANDKSLAMTGSFTSMIVAGFLIARIDELAFLKSQIEQVATIGTTIISEYAPRLKEVATLDFNRGIFLGAGPFFGIAHESHLKVQELTDGKVVCKYDSCLGFRHGPKAVIDNKSLIVFHLSSDDYAYRYEADLLEDIHNRKDGLYRIAVGKSRKNVPVDLFIDLQGADMVDSTLLTVCSVLPGQLLGFFKSIDVGLSPDEPSVSGNISRVVKGVHIYPYKENVQNV